MRQIGLVLSCCVIAVALFWAWTALSARDATPLVPRVEAPKPVDRSPITLSDEQPAQAEARASAPVESPSDARAPTSAGKSAFTVRGRCVDEQSAPLAEVEVRLAGYANESELGERTGVGSDSEPLAVARSDREGRFVLEFARPGEGRVASVGVGAHSSGRAPERKSAEVEQGATEADVGDLVLTPGVTLAGSVRDALGAVVAGAKLHVQRSTGGEGFRDLGSSGETQPNGTFRLVDAPAGKIRVHVRTQDRRYGTGAVLDVAPGARVDGLEIVVPAYDDANAISGVVLDVDGTAIAQAKVSADYALEGGGGSMMGLETDERGRFRFEARPGGTYTLNASHPVRRTSPAVLTGVRPGQHGLVLRLLPEQTCTVRVRDDAGAPVTRFGLRTKTESSLRTMFSNAQEESERRNGEADFTVEVVPFSIELRATGYETTLIGPFDPAKIGSLVEATMQRLPALRGRVVARGSPVPGALVVALGALGSNDVGSIETFDVLVGNCQGCPQMRTDENGYFTIPLATRGRWHARAQAPGHPSLVSGAVIVEPGVVVPHLQLDLGPRGAIEGFVRSEDQTPVARAVVAASCGDGLVRTATSDAQGRYRIENLAPGSWQVRALPSNWIVASAVTGEAHYVRGKPPVEWDCQVSDGGTTYHDVTLAPQSK